MQLHTMLLSPPTLILLEASRSTWKSADPVQMRMEATSRGEGECAVAVEVTRAVQEAAREGVAFRRMEDAVAILEVDEEAVDSRLHNPPVPIPSDLSLPTTSHVRARTHLRTYSRRISTLDTNIQWHQAVDFSPTF